MISSTSRLLGAALLGLALGCSPVDAPKDGAPAQATSGAGLTGAGATFPNPI